MAERTKQNEVIKQTQKIALDPKPETDSMRLIVETYRGAIRRKATAGLAEVFDRVSAEEESRGAK